MVSREKRAAVVYAAVGSLPESAFLMKLTEVFASHQVEWQLRGWARKRTSGVGGLRDNRITPILVGGGYSNRLLALWYPLWMLRVFVDALCAQRAICVCLGLYAALPVVVASLVRGHTVVFANMDNEALSYRWPRIMSWLLEGLERIVAARARIHVVPSRSRWRFADANLMLVPNTPTTSTWSEALRMADAKHYCRGGTFVIYVNGWLTATRGLATLRKALTRVSPESVKVLVAGEPRCFDAVELLKMQHVTYLGSLSLSESLAVYLKSHVAFTYYDPAVPINRLAEPNKWGDCVLARTPFICNAEVLTGEPYVKRKACFSLPYDDADGLSELLKTLASRRELWDEVQGNLLQFPARTWDAEVEPLIKSLWP